jgi:hypothetical protein
MRFLAFFVFCLLFASSLQFSSAQDNIGTVSDICLDPSGVCDADPTLTLPIPSCSSVADCDAQIAQQQGLLATAPNAYYVGYYQRCIDALNFIRTGLLINPGPPLPTCSSAAECLNQIAYYNNLIMDPSVSPELLKWYVACVTVLQNKYFQLTQPVSGGGGGGGGGGGSGSWDSFQKWVKCLDKIDCCMAAAVESISSGDGFSYDRSQAWSDCNTSGTTSCGNHCN